MSAARTDSAGDSGSAISPPAKPHSLWVESQYGLFFDCPQRQSEYAGFSSSSVPSDLSSGTPPSTR